MRRSVSTKLAGIASVFLVASGSSGCFTTYVQARSEECPPSTAKAMAQLLDLDAIGDNEALVSWIADDVLPFCRGLMAINE